METVFHVSTLPLDMQLVVEKTVVGAIPTLTIKTVLKEKDVPILEITHGTAEMNSIPSSAQLDGYVTQIKGQCIVGKPGEGYALNSTCTVFCGDPTPPADQKKYKCNITDFTCQTCKPGDSACVTDRNAACGNCKDTVDTFKCDKTDPKAPKCNKCPANETSGCADRNTACHSCIPPQNK